MPFRSCDRHKALEFTDAKDCFACHGCHRASKGQFLSVLRSQLRSESYFVDRESRELSPGKRYIAKMENVECWKVVAYSETPIEMPL
jgi:hypothetical protein